MKASTSQPSHHDAVSKALKRLKDSVAGALADGHNIESSFDHSCTRRNQRDITEREFMKGLRLLDIDIDRSQCSELMERFNPRKQGLISFDDFKQTLTATTNEFDELAAKVQGIVKRRGRGERDLMDVFLEFDRDDSGEVDEYEFEDALKELRIDLRRGEARKLLKRFYVDGNGRISYREFVDFAKGRNGSPRKSRTSSSRSSRSGY